MSLLEWSFLNADEVLMLSGAFSGGVLAIALGLAEWEIVAAVMLFSMATLGAKQFYEKTKP